MIPHTVPSQTPQIKDSEVADGGPRIHNVADSEEENSKQTCQHEGKPKSPDNYIRRGHGGRMERERHVNN